MIVKNGKHSEHGNEPVYFVICTLFEGLRLHKLHSIPWSTWTGITDAIFVRF